MKCQIRKYFFQELKYFFSIKGLHTVALSVSLLRFVKGIRKGIKKKTELLFKIVVFHKQRNLSESGTDVSIRFHALRTLAADAGKNREIMKPVRTLVSNGLNCPWI